MKKIVSLIIVSAASAFVSGCGGFFDDLAAYQAPIDQSQPIPQTDYVAACHTYGCPSTPVNRPPVNTGPGCKTPNPDGSYSTTGTACPQ